MIFQYLRLAIKKRNLKKALGKSMIPENIVTEMLSSVHMGASPGKRKYYFLCGDTKRMPNHPSDIRCKMEGLQEVPEYSSRYKAE